MGGKPKIKLTVIEKKGPGNCHYKHRVGDVFDFDTQRGALCPMALHAGFPYIDILRYGGYVPGEKNSDTCTFCCPDANVINIFKVERVRKESVNR